MVLNKFRKPGGALFQDIGQLAGGALSLVEGLREELKRDMQDRLDALVSRLDLVPRKDFERLEAMVMKMRAEQETGQRTGPKTGQKAAAPAVKASAVKKAPAAKAGKAAKGK